MRPRRPWGPPSTLMGARGCGCPVGYACVCPSWLLLGPPAPQPLHFSGRRTAPRAGQGPQGVQNHALDNPTQVRRLLNPSRRLPPGPTLVQRPRRPWPQLEQHRPLASQPKPAAFGAAATHDAPAGSWIRVETGGDVESVSDRAGWESNWTPAGCYFAYITHLNHTSKTKGEPRRQKILRNCSAMGVLSCWKDDHFRQQKARRRAPRW